MILRPSILCPVDFSVHSRGALRFAMAIAEHFGARLNVLTVNDPLLTDAAQLVLQEGWQAADTDRELRRFFAEAFEHRSLPSVEVAFDIATGKPAPEILRVAHEQACDLIVMSTHGLTGVRKLFFGSTTERVLRETTVPILVTPPSIPGPLFLEDVRKLIPRVLAPVDLGAASERQVEAARALAEAIDVPLLLAHVVEPLRSAFVSRLHLPNVDVERRERADQRLVDLAANIPPRLKPETLTAYGDPAEEVAKIANDRQVGLIVIGLHASTSGGPRMGSVTYRVLCLTRALVLALPPAAISTTRHDARQNGDTATIAKATR